MPNKQLSECLATTFYPRKSAIHDCVDTGTAINLTEVGGEVPYTVDCAGRDYLSSDPLWHSGNIIKDTIDNAVLSVKLRFTLNSTVNTLITFRFYIPHPTFGDIPIDSLQIRAGKNGVDELHSVVTSLYNGTDSDAKTHGFKIGMSADGNAAISNRSILITA